jgi:hypothetical protein
VRPTVQRVVDSMHGTPAVVSNGRLDILHANALGRALFAPVFAFADPNRPPNSARFVFLDPAAKALYRLSRPPHDLTRRNHTTTIADGTLRLPDCDARASPIAGPYRSVGTRSLRGGSVAFHVTRAH